MNSEQDILARTLFGEARGEYHRMEGGLSALIAIGNVVMNRVSQKSWYGANISDVCLKPWQFSCWNKGDPNYLLIKSRVMDDPLYFVCQDVAMAVMSGQWPDLTGGADHYHAIDLLQLPPWARRREPIRKIGRHLFYKLSGGET